MVLGGWWLVVARPKSYDTILRFGGPVFEETVRTDGWRDVWRLLVMVYSANVGISGCMYGRSKNVRIVPLLLYSTRKENKSKKEANQRNPGPDTDPDTDHESQTESRTPTPIPRSQSRTRTATPVRCGEMGENAGRGGQGSARQGRARPAAQKYLSKYECEWKLLRYEVCIRYEGT